MATRREMVNAGSYITEAQGVNGNFDYNVSAVGTTQAAAYKINSSNTVVKTATAGTNDGLVLPIGDAGDWIQVFNYSGVTIKVYPPVGWALHGGSVNASVSVGAGKTADFTQMTDPTKTSLPAGFSQHEYAVSISA
jgi:hypothetical protein